MNKILLIIQREYLSRVKKKSFIVMTLLVPILMGGLFAGVLYLSHASDEKKGICIVDETGLFYKELKDTKDIFYSFSDDLENAKTKLNEGAFSGLLYIPKQAYGIPTDAFILYAKDQPSLFIQTQIENNLQELLRNNILLEAHNISLDDYNLINNTKIKIHAQNIQTGKDSFIELKTGLGMGMGILIYFFIFMFGSQVMTGVMEEKTNRIVEVLISSIRPFQLMLGKIVGIALVALTQFALWVAFIFILLSVAQTTVLGDTLKNVDTHQFTNEKVLNLEQIQSQVTQNGTFTAKISEAISSIDFNVMLGSFLFFFLFGYLFYATLFATIGSIVENQSDSQQFMLPVTIPLILSMMLISSIIKNPGGPVAFWFSIIPFTSPIVMLIRIPFGVPFWQLYLSMGVLILSFLGSTWMSGKIYRTGILMYGKKITYSEIWKWLKYKN